MLGEFIMQCNAYAVPSPRTCGNISHVLALKGKFAAKLLLLLRP